MQEDFRAKARRIWEEIFPKGDVAALAEIIHPNSINHGSRQGLRG